MGLIFGGGSFIGEVMGGFGMGSRVLQWLVGRWSETSGEGILGDSIGGAQRAFYGGIGPVRKLLHHCREVGGVGCID